MYDFHNRITGLTAIHAGVTLTPLDCYRRVFHVLSHRFVTVRHRGFSSRLPSIAPESLARIRLRRVSGDAGTLSPCL